VGKEITVSVGARLAPQFYEPAVVTGRIKLISDGEFVQKGPGARGLVYHRGKTVILKIDHIFLVVAERPVIQWDPEFYRSVGLEPADAQIVVVKSPSAFRAAYEPIAADIVVVDAPGVCSPNLRSLPFKKVRRPLYPLDDLDEWRMTA
jgi:microcystin degradation protein MlrC